MTNADRPQTDSAEEYHTHTRKGDVAEICIIGGAPGRMKDMAEKSLTDVKFFNNGHRGILTFTGYYKGVRLTLATSGMGVPYIGIVMPELIRCGARIFIRIGSCGCLVKHSKPGDAMIVNRARLWDGVSPKWVPWWKRLWHAIVGIPSDHRVTAALEKAAQLVPKLGQVHIGAQGTTSDFYTGQTRPGLFGEIPWFLRFRHWFCMLTGWIKCYSMEMAGMLAFCRYKAGGLPAGGVEAVYANRHTGEFAPLGEEFCASIVLEAAVILAGDESLRPFLTGEFPVYPETA